VLEELFALLATLAILLVGTVTRPTRAHCPEGWHLSEGIRTWTSYQPIGSFACQRPLVGLENDAPERPGTLRGRLYCAHPRSVGDRHVRCD
jgi:hypothetical protein